MVTYIRSLKKNPVAEEVVEVLRGPAQAVAAPGRKVKNQDTSWGLSYLWSVGNGGKVVIVVIIVPHSSIPY